MGPNKIWMFKGIIFFHSLCILLSILAETAQASDTQPFFHPKEKLVFKVKWAFIHAGDAMLEILPIESINGRQAYHFTMIAGTTEFVDLFYKIRDKIDSYTDIGMTHSLLYMKHQQGQFKKDIIVDMDWKKGSARYSNFGEKESSIPIQPGSFDPLSVFYAFRNKPLTEDSVMGIPVTDGKKCIMSKAKVIKRETIQVPCGVFDTFLVEPQMDTIDGIFMKRENAKLQIWVTADTRQMPVRIKSGVKVGSFVAELVSYEMGSHY